MHLHCTKLKLNNFTTSASKLAHTIALAAEVGIEPRSTRLCQYLNTHKDRGDSHSCIQRASVPVGRCLELAKMNSQKNSDPASKPASNDPHLETPKGSYIFDVAHAVGILGIGREAANAQMKSWRGYSNYQARLLRI